MHERRKCFYNVEPKAKYEEFIKTEKFHEGMDRLGFKVNSISPNKNLNKGFIGIFEFNPDTCGDAIGWLNELGFTFIIIKPSRVTNLDAINTLNNLKQAIA